MIQQGLAEHPSPSLVEPDCNMCSILQGINFQCARLLNRIGDNTKPLLEGNDSLAAAVSWIIDHENDPDIDQMPSDKVYAV
ncbi:hypothetical protein CK203_109284 [Vitis vinifera]|uniref:Uncharacterized protein n=1 Tax=Vitis vinifera TaxID=29760 RepID=A0A438DAG0_VITVI|nr:hypothetical protein CK203_109284 [Vitis vinifera]